MRSESKPVETRPKESRPAWDTWEEKRHRTLLFLVLAGLYISFQLVSRWVEFAMFRFETFYSPGRVSVPFYELVYRWVLTFLPVAVWCSFLFILLTRFSSLTHRRVAIVLVLGGLMFLEADMQWFSMSKKHVGYTEIVAFFTVDASQDLGLRNSDYSAFQTLFLTHTLALLGCAILAGPELRAVVSAILNGPAQKTYLGKGCLRVLNWGGRFSCWTRANRLLSYADTKLAAVLIFGLFLVDPVIIWALDREEQDIEQSRSVVRELAEGNPLRFQALDRAWRDLVLRFSEEAQDLEKANNALAEISAPTFPLPTVSEAQAAGLFLPKPPLSDKPKNVVLIQVESLSAAVWDDTDLPFVKEFSKKCLRLKRHYSVANCTHYGVLGLIHGDPPTFFHGGGFSTECRYLNTFKEHGYRTKLLSMRIMDHHSLGDYISNWTEPVYLAPNDWAVIPEFHKEISKPGPQLSYLFYNCTHYPYFHADKYAKHQPAVDYEFSYNRSDLILYKDQIVNRYKNALLEFDDWLRTTLEKVDLTQTIVVITGDHGEEFFQQGRLGHCSSLNMYQTRTPCLVYIPGVEPQDINFPTSNADMMPTIADALGWKAAPAERNSTVLEKPRVLGRSLFEPVPFRYAVVANFEYKKPERFAIVTEDRKTTVVRDGSHNLEIIALTDWEGRRIKYSDQPERWVDNFRIVRLVETELKFYAKNITR